MRWALHLDALDSRTEPCKVRGKCRSHMSHVKSFEVARRAIQNHLREHAERHAKRACDFLEGISTWEDQTEKGWRE